MENKQTFIYRFRFELFFFSLLLILFGSLFFPLNFYITYVEPGLFLLNILAGVKLLEAYPKIHLISWIIFLKAPNMTSIKFQNFQTNSIFGLFIARKLRDTLQWNFSRLEKKWRQPSWLLIWRSKETFFMLLQCHKRFWNQPSFD